MVWKAKVLISEHIYDSFSPLMQIVRMFGIFPLVVRKTRAGVFLQQSPWFALYGYSLGLTIITATIFGAISETFTRETAKLEGASFVDVLVTTFPLSGYCTSTFFGIFIMASKTSSIFNYFTCVRKADAAIKTGYSRYNKYKSLLLPAIVFVNSEIIHFINIHVFKTFIGSKLGVFKKIVTRHAPFLINIYVSLAVEFLIRLMTYNLELRFDRLSAVLEQHYLKKSLEENKPEENETEEETAILKLAQVYLTLKEAAGMVNDLFGLNILVVVAATFFDLISTSYFLMLVLEGLQKNGVELTIQLFIFSFNILRVLTITEPMYSCMGKIRDVEVHVCNLLSLNIGARYRQQVHIFAVCIYLTPLEFSACGLFTIDRLLISTFIGGITNYVVILLGLKQDK